MANYKTIEQLDAGITKALFDPKGRGVAELLTLKKLALGKLSISPIRAEVPVYRGVFCSSCGQTSL